MTTVDDDHPRPSSPITTSTSTSTSTSTIICPADDNYHSDDYANRDTPPPPRMKINLKPTPSPPRVLPRPSTSPLAGSGASRKTAATPSQSDVVLVSFMGGGKNHDIAVTAGQQPLAWDEEDDADATVRATPVAPMASNEKEGEERKGVERMARDEGKTDTEKLMLTALAANALRATLQAAPAPEARENTRTSLPSAKIEPWESARHARPSAAPHQDELLRPKSSRDPTVKLELKGSPGELPPIRQLSPQSSFANHSGPNSITLPSLSAQLGDLKQLAQAASAESQTLSQSPPPRRPPTFSSVAGHGSPPKSPHEAFRSLPSPGQNTRHFYPHNGGHRRPSQAEGTPYTSAGDYSTSTTETPSTDQSASTPAMGIDRMSIDGITNHPPDHPSEMYRCDHSGCTAQAFQTQYLLNSHKNVHSSVRPHYCPQKGCPRSEGGKGFKRKNEMIRHGLVHDSPGYICPFCKDKEHRYPRPDNLQRHVRVHHPNEEKDDIRLRDVLAQRPEGPNRGRRRRGGTA